MLNRKSAKTKSHRHSKAFILEPILTPSSFVDTGLDDGPDVPDEGFSLPADPWDGDSEGSMGDETDLGDNLDFPGSEAEISEPESMDVGTSDLGENYEEIEFFPTDPFIPETSGIEFTSGVFTVGESGEVSIDYLFDGGKYDQGELAIFSLDGMDSEPGTRAFIQEAAQRALSNSELGYVVISDATDAARFSNTGGVDFNTGEYRGVQTFQMKAGDRFGFMLVPNQSIATAAEGRAWGTVFSMATANPDDYFQFGQIADVTGDGNTFTLEDISLAGGRSDRDYDDIIFQVRGATANAPLMDEVLAEGRDWRTSAMGQALLNYAQAYTDQVDYSVAAFNAAREFQPLVGIIDTGFAANNPDIDYSNITLGRDWIDGDDNPLLTAGEGNEHGTHVLGIIAAQRDNGIGIDGINPDAPIWLGRAVGSGQWANSLVEFVDAAVESGQPNAVVNLSLDLTQIDANGEVFTRYEFTPMERAAIEYARQNNVLLVVAAGNDGGVMSALGQASQEFDNIITVGAAELITPELEPFKGYESTRDSGSGKALDLVADVDSSLEGVPNLTVATAKVTGAVSHVWAANPDLSYRQVIDILQRTATDLGTPNWNPDTGAGLLNITAAIHLAKVTSPQHTSSSYSLIANGWTRYDSEEEQDKDLTPSHELNYLLKPELWLNNAYEFFKYLSQSNDPQILPVLDLLRESWESDDFSPENFTQKLAQYNAAILDVLSNGANDHILDAISINILHFSVGEGSPTEEIAEIFQNTLSNYGGVSYVGNPVTLVQKVEAGYIQKFNLGGAGEGAILYGEGNERAVFLSGDEWLEFLKAGGVLVQGYPTQHASLNDDLSDGLDSIDDFIDLTLEPESDVDENDVRPDFIYSSSSQTRPREEWLKQFGNSTSDRSRGVTTDNHGNVYVASSSYGSNGQPDFILTKYNSQGTEIWSRQYPTDSWEFPTNIAVDGQGNIYTSGYEHDHGWNHSTLKKWDSNGNPIWSRRIQRGYDEWSSDLSIDYNGNVYIVGHTSSSFAGSNAGQNDAYIAKFSPNGHQIWSDQIGTSDQDTARSVVTDRWGNVYVAGITEGSLGGTQQGISDVFVVKYDQYGNRQWIKQFGSPGFDGRAGREFTGTHERNVVLDVDSNGNLYVAGRTHGSFAGANAGGSDAFLVKLNQWGNEVWKRQFGDSGNEYVTGLKVDEQGNLYVAGVTDSSINGTTHSGGHDSFVAKYSNHGTQLWVKQMGTEGDDIVRDIALDRDGNLLLSGYTTGAFTGYSLTGGADTFVSKWTIAPNRAPIVQASDQSIQVGQSFAPSFTVTDPDGDPIKHYRFFDSNTSDNSGYFTVNGVRQAAGRSFTVAGDQLNTVRFVGGSVATSDRVFVSASDGSAWGNWNGFTIESRQANRRPVVSANDQSVNVGQSIIPSFNVTDPDGDQIVRYYFYDYNTQSSSGYFTVNGVRQLHGFFVDADKLHTVRFVGGSVAGEDRVGVWASDGQSWGSAQFTIETKQVNRRPIISASNQTVRRNQSIQPSFTVTDPDGDTMTHYAFFDGNSDSNSGYFTVNGVQQAAGRTFTVPANQLHTVQFVGGSVTGDDRLYVTAYDGQAWGNWASFLMTTQGGSRPIVQASHQSVGINQSIQPSFTVTDPDGDPITYYRFFDGNSSSTSGYFTVNGVRQQAGRVFHVPANQLHTVRFVGGSVAGDDLVYVSATDGRDGYSFWRSFAISTDTAGNSLNAARNIQLGQNIAEHVSQYDRDDYYRFTVNEKTRINLGLTGLTGDADLYLLNSGGSILTSSTRRGTASESLTRDLEPGTYYVRVQNHMGDTRYTLTTSGQAIQTGPQFTNFSVRDASGDGSLNTVFQRGALQLNWMTDQNNVNVRVYARNQSTGAVVPLTVQNGLVNLNTQHLNAGSYSIYATAQDASGNVGKSSEHTIQVLAFNPHSANSVTVGTFRDDHHTAHNRTQGSVFIGRGGTDILDLSDYHSSSITFNPNTNAVFGGTTFDWLRINPTGQEIYFQGYEQIKFSNTTINLGVTPNDPLFSQQWNLRMMDVSGAWRFTQGSRDVLLGNIDSGLDLQNGHEDIDSSRLIIPDWTSHDDSNGLRAYGHGTGVHGIMAGTPNNGKGVTGINWNSDIYVADIFGPSNVGSSQALRDIGNYADSHSKNAVVNNSWSYSNSHLWNTGDSRANHVKSTMDNSVYKDQTLYVFASGNNSHTSISYPARLAAELENVISVGAVNQNGTRIHYSNYGEGLTLVAPSHVPSTHINGNYYIPSIFDPGFNGTSAAAPNASGVASLVWSANTGLQSGDIKDILTSTANQVWRINGGSNSGNQYGAGLVDAEAAVRRSYALAQNAAVAGLFNHQGLFFV